ncbi:hypothetical protein Dimus_025250 [Dionaea muscipula]
MDRKDSMPMSGSSSYYVQRGMPMPELSGHHGINPLSSPNLGFQSNPGGSSSSQVLMVDPTTSAILPDGMNVAASSMQPSNVPMKRKRGRPRKYGTTERPVSLALSPSSSNSQGMHSPSPTQKRGRGRPPGTGRKQQSGPIGEFLSGSAGVGFTPHVITVATGEDIAANIIAFAQQGPRAVCILSANGAVSTVTLRQQSSSGGIVTYEGRFDILCMSGSLLLIDNDGSRGRTGGLSISLASPDGRVIGGGVGGMLIAASPVQVILGSFAWGESSNTKNKLRQEGSEAGGSSEHHHHHHHPPSVDNTGRDQGGGGGGGASSMGAWGSSQHGVDMENSHFDIDLMRG